MSRRCCANRALNSEFCRHEPYPIQTVSRSSEKVFRHVTNVQIKKVPLQMLSECLNFASMLPEVPKMHRVFPRSSPEGQVPTSPNDLLDFGLREIHRTDQLKTSLTTVSNHWNSHLPSCGLASHSGTFADLADSEEDAEETHSHLRLNLARTPPRPLQGSPRLWRTFPDPEPLANRNVLDESLRQQSDEAAIPIDDALKFVSGLFSRARQTASAGTSRSSSTQGSGRVRSQRQRVRSARTMPSRNSRNPPIQTSRILDSARALQIEADG
jgi:hypothetical protein